MKKNTFVGSNMADVKFPPKSNCEIEVMEKFKQEDHFITVGKKEVDGVKPTNFHPLLEKGETFILPHQIDFDGNIKKVLKITIL